MEDEPWFAHYPVKEIEQDGAKVSLFLGKFGNQEIMEAKTHAPVNVFGIEINAGKSFTFASTQLGALLYVKQGTNVSVNGKKVGEKELAVFDSKAKGDVTVQNESEKDSARVFFAEGEPVEGPWVKLLTNNGFLLAADEESAKKKEKELEVLLKKAKVNE